MLLSLSPLPPKKEKETHIACVQIIRELRDIIKNKDFWALIIAFSLRARFEASLSQGLALMNGDLTRVNDYQIAFILLLRKLAPPAGLEPATR